MNASILAVIITVLGSAVFAQNLVLLPENQNRDDVVVLGASQFAGAGCGAAANALMRGNGELVITVGMAVNKLKASALDRKACTMVLPAQMAPGYRLIAKRVELRGSTLIQKGAAVKISAEVFAAGSESEKLEAAFAPTVTALKRSVRIVKEVPANKAELVSCGGSANLRMNSSVISTGAKKSALTKIDIIELSATIEKCN